DGPLVRPLQSARLPLPLDFGHGTATHEPATGACRHVDPRIALAIFLRGPGTRRVRRLAVVLTGFGDPIALLRLELGLRSWPSLSDSGQRQRGGEGGGHEETGGLHRLHRVSPYLESETIGALRCRVSIHSATSAARYDLQPTRV